MERQFPKNVKQIGNVSDSPRIYLEDYVETFLNQLEEQDPEETIGAFLLGEKMQIEGEDCVFITGALQIRDMPAGEEACLGKEHLEVAKAESREYFHEEGIVGWFQTTPGRPAALSREMARTHEQLFAEKNSLLILRGQGKDLYFVYKFHELMEIGGHYIFYEKNPDMQSYMIRERRQIGVTPCEVVEDRAAKDFRSTIKGRMEVREQKRESRYVYLTSVLLVVVVLAIGISTMNNYDKINAVQESIETLSSAMRLSALKKEEKDETAKIQLDAETAAVSGEDEEKNAAADSGETVGEGDAGKEESGKEGSDQEASYTGTTPDPSTIQEELGQKEEYYIVQKGDTLDLISRKLYGTTSETDAICRMNGLTDGNLIFIGQKLLLP